MESRFAHLITAPEQVTHAADRGVYAAKAAGRNCVRSVDLSAPAPAEVAGVLAAPAAEVQPRTVMIVEDDPLAARLMSFLFSKCKDLKPVVVKSGEDAVEWVASPSAARPKPDLIVSDLNLPGMSGIELMKAVHANSPSRRTPFMIVTAAANAATQAASLSAGAVAFVDKAEFCTNTEHWLKTIGNLLERSRIAA